MSQGPLPYATVTFRQRWNPWPTVAVIVGGTAAVIGFTCWRGVHVPMWAWLATATGLTAMIALCTSPALRHECWIEGDVLWVRAGRRPAAFPIDDLISINQIIMPEGPVAHEITLRDGGRVAVTTSAFDPIEPLRAAVRAINPGVRFGTHSGVHCRACGASLVPSVGRPSIRELIEHARRPTCPACGEPVRGRRP